MKRKTNQRFSKRNPGAIPVKVILSLGLGRCAHVPHCIDSKATTVGP